MTDRTLDRLVAVGLFLFALILYLMTVSPSVSFWDPGERIAASYGLQIPHPPGAPFYMLLNRIFSMFVPVQYVALSIALVNVLASALTVMLTHLIIVRLAKEWKGAREEWSKADTWSVLGGGVIGALALAVSDAFWFNALEAETYAVSLCFTALCIWLTLRWLEQARHQDALLAAGQHHVFGSGAERWLIAIAYLYGLAIGIHLLSILSIFFVTLIVYFQQFDRPEWTLGQRLKGLLFAGLASVGVFLLIFPGIVQWLPEMARSSGMPALFLIGVIVLLVFALRYTQQKQMHVPNLLLLVVTVVLIGYSSYALIMIRSAANPPIDQNDPETVDAFVSYMKREQYGAVPLLKGPAYNNQLRRVDTNSEVLLTRRWSAMPEHERFYAQYSSNLDFFWRYQINEMYLRYFMWQWSGRESDMQGARWITGIWDDKMDEAIYTTPSEQAGRSVYFLLPLLLGLFGLGYHVANDKRRALAVGVLFFITGLGIVLYLNQTPLQPRERDYSYTGSFFAFSLWIGIGAVGIIELVANALKSKETKQSVLAAGIATALLLAAVPGNMLLQNYDSHDRSGRYVAADLGYNMLNSVAENAILFTNGDNDTFPLWYLQEVEGVRRDVRVVNLSLLQTSWYVKQLKHQWSRDSAPIPMTLTDPEIENLRPSIWDPVTIHLPISNVSEDVLREWGNPTDVPETMEWHIPGRPYAQDVNVVYANDLVIQSILQAVAEDGWQRPVYFATTTGGEGQSGLSNYLQIEGLAMRVTPIRHTGRMERVVPQITLTNLENFRFRNLDNENVYFDQNKRGLIDSYRSSVFAPIARELARTGQPEEARAVLAQIRESIPFETVAPSFVSLYMLAEAYNTLGDSEGVVEMMRRAEPLALRQLDNAQSTRALDIAVQYIQTIQSLYLENEAFEEAAAFSDALAITTGDARYRQSADELREMYEERMIPETTEVPVELLEGEPSP